MKVLHYQHNGAGVVISDGLKKIGIKSSVVATGPHLFGFKEDYLVKGPKDLVKFDDYDILHNHDSKCKFPKKVRKMFEGRIVQHYHNAMMTKKEITKQGDAIFISALNVQEVLPEATWIPLPVDTDKFVPTKSRREYIAIGYNDSSLDKRKRKYLVNDEVREAAEILRKRGIDVILRPQPFGIPHHEMLEKYWSTIDVWVDRFGLEFYGFSAVEAASCGIPVVSDMPEYRLTGLPDCPFVLTTREKLIEALTTANFLNQSWKRAHRDYAFRVHDSAWVATLCYHKYCELI